MDLMSLVENVMGRRDLRCAGLRGLAKEILGKMISEPKDATTCRWDNEWLTMNQVSYASVDVFLSSEIGRRLSIQGN